jgi:hypothetical protein
MVAPRRAVRSVVRAMTEAHPYEEVAYDVYALENTAGDYGMGTIGTLRRTSRSGRSWQWCAGT